MKVTIDGSPQEIAALVGKLQGRHQVDNEETAQAIARQSAKAVISVIRAAKHDIDAANSV